jgi:3-dehydroquinate synthase
VSAHTIQVAVVPRYSVDVGAGIVARAADRPQGWSRTFVLTDANVARLHGAALAAIPRASVHAVPPGEDSKSFRELERVLDALVAAGCDRASGLVAFGGGVVGDLGGLAAALYHRGIACVQVPTTLLAMVDSSVGGKTAVNLAAGKNLAGAFHQPDEVVADVRFLVTLPDDEYRSGLGEVVKTAVLDGDLFHRLRAQPARLARRDEAELVDVVAACVRRKALVVASDPREQGARKLLNLGHTFAHAIEHVAGYGRIPHGIAVATGILLAAEAGRVADLGVDAGFAGALADLLAALDVPHGLRALSERHGAALESGALLLAMARDKKSRRGVPQFVVPFGPAAVRHDVALPEAAVRAALDRSTRG